jgi:hypothetical protein
VLTVGSFAILRGEGSHTYFFLLYGFALCEFVG